MQTSPADTAATELKNKDQRTATVNSAGYKYVDEGESRLTGKSSSYYHYFSSEIQVIPGVCKIGELGSGFSSRRWFCL